MPLRNGRKILEGQLAFARLACVHAEGCVAKSMRAVSRSPLTFPAFGPTSRMPPAIDGIWDFLSTIGGIVFVDSGLNRG